MKIKKRYTDKSAEKQLISLELRRGTIAQIDEAAKKAGISRRAIVEAILVQVLNDKSFVLKVD